MGLAIRPTHAMHAFNFSDKNITTSIAVENQSKKIKIIIVVKKHLGVVSSANLKIWVPNTNQII